MRVHYALAHPCYCGVGAARPCRTCTIWLRLYRQLMARRSWAR